ncbi:MAG: transporter [Alphaproteobacteria bacterium]|nr:transporter [Alphaproteobacteria bacterium]
MAQTLVRTGRIGRLLILAMLAPWAGPAAGCPTASEAIDTDRPDVTNSSRVVPRGSLQAENGVNLTGRGSAAAIDGTNTRVRLGMAECTEVLVDLPSYARAVRGDASSGFSDVSPAVKRELQGLPDGVTVSAVAGFGVPTGNRPFGGHGYRPYLQVPWDADIGSRWRLAGMATAFFHPVDSRRNPTLEPTLVLGRAVDERFDLFLEYVGDYPVGSRPSHLLNSGAAFRLTPTQQIDVHVAAGLNGTAPDYIVGLGYSIRLDGLF